MTDKKQPEDNRDIFDKALEDPRVALAAMLGGGVAGGALGRRFMRRGARKEVQLGNDLLELQGLPVRVKPSYAKQYVDDNGRFGMVGGASVGTLAGSPLAVEGDRRRKLRKRKK